jgi:hypothetical protein
VKPRNAAKPKTLRRKLRTVVDAGDLEEAFDLAERQLTAGLGYHADVKSAVGSLVRPGRYSVHLIVDVR